MRGNWKLTALSGVLLLIGAQTRAASHSEAARKSIQELMETFEEAWNQNDASALAALWAEDGDLINPFGRWAKSRAEVETLFTEEHAGPMKDTTYESKLEAIQLLGSDVAVVTWSASIKGMKAPDGSAAQPFDHWVTSVLVKKDGKWWVAAARAMVPLPPPGGATTQPS